MVRNVLAIEMTPRDEELIFSVIPDNPLIITFLPLDSLRLVLVGCIGFNHVVIPGDLPAFQINRIQGFLTEFNPIDAVDDRHVIITGERPTYYRYNEFINTSDGHRNVLVLCSVTRQVGLHKRIVDYFYRNADVTWMFLEEAHIGDDWTNFVNEDGHTVSTNNSVDLIIADNCKVNLGDGTSVFTPKTVQQLSKVLKKDAFIAFPYRAVSPHLFNVVSDNINFSVSTNQSLFTEYLDCDNDQGVVTPIYFISRVFIESLQRTLHV